MSCKTIRNSAFYCFVSNSFSRTKAADFSGQHSQHIHSELDKALLSCDVCFKESMVTTGFSNHI